MVFTPKGQTALDEIEYRADSVKREVQEELTNGITIRYRGDSPAGGAAS